MYWIPVNIELGPGREIQVIFTSLTGGSTMNFSYWLKNAANILWSFAIYSLKCHYCLLVTKSTRCTFGSWSNTFSASSPNVLGRDIHDVV